MLDLRWRQTVASSPHAGALRDTATGRVWTFAELEAEADSVRIDDGSGLVHPIGRSVGFILALLRAWRAGRPVCPLEPGQPPPVVPPPPAGIAHLKLTSGTTGAPRCVAFTAGQLAADADAIVATMGLSPEQPDLGVVSLAHSYGFSNLVLPLLLLVKHSPEAIGQRPDGAMEPPLGAADAPRVASDISGDFTLREGMRTRTYWIIVFSTVVRTALTGAVQGQLIPIVDY